MSHPAPSRRVDYLFVDGFVGGELTNEGSPPSTPATVSCAPC